MRLSQENTSLPPGAVRSAGGGGFRPFCGAFVCVALPRPPDSPATGREKKEIAKPKLDISIFATPIVADGVFYVASMTRLYAIKCGPAGNAESWLS